MQPTRIVKRCSFVMAAVLIGGCAVPSQQASFDSVSALTQRKGTGTLQWIRDDAEAAQVDHTVQELLSTPLTSENAVKIALINNRVLQQLYSQIGIAHSELVQAGLLSNPVLGYSLGHGNGVEKTTWNIEWAFLDLLWMPMRRQLSGLALEETKYRVGDAVMRTVRDVEKGYADAVVAEGLLRRNHDVLTSSEVSVQLAARQYAAGNLSKRAYLKIRDDYERMRLDTIRLKQDYATARESLNRLLGVYGDRTYYTLPAMDETLRFQWNGTDEWEHRALQGRLDVAAARARVEYAAKEAGFTADTRLLESFTLEAERESNSDERQAFTTFGGKLSVPLFDTGAAGVEASQSRYLEALHALYETAISVRSEVRESYARARYAYEIAEEQANEIVPTNRMILEETQKHYNGMLEGIDELLADQRRYVETRMELLREIGEYRKAMADFTYTIGGEVDAGQ